MKIGPARIAHSITLAPVEEHTNFPFRDAVPKVRDLAAFRRLVKNHCG